MVLETVLVAVWAMGPAYVPNNVAVVAGGGRPVDGGRTLGDGSRVLGDGKTWRGTVVGTAAGIAVALLLNAGRDAVGAAALPAFPLSAAVGLAFGAMFGDILASFLKRRTGRERGAVFPGLDQLDFVVGSLVLASAAATGWFFETFTPGVLAAVFVVTPVLHLSTNGVAYAFGLKDEPW
jgi:CDP-2,3-bis-(O-geranylgeranyl)-sn-glycerol synthase